MTTGYWARGSTTNRSKVHYVASDGPICGSRPSGEYMVCGQGPHVSIVECKKCPKALEATYVRWGQARPRRRTA